jgi:hypothetical protein
MTDIIQNHNEHEHGYWPPIGGTKLPSQRSKVSSSAWMSSAGDAFAEKIRIAIYNH